MSASAQNGIFADIQTSLGTFICQLDHTNAPKAVANFIGLATGQHPWIDPVTGVVRTNVFYNGLTFHRVIAGFMSQAGSPNGLGTDGPGYAIVDEFTPLLRFDASYKLAMANSGPNSSGSQFFLTSAPTPWLNDVHTIFGWLVSGTNVADAINAVQTDVSNKPLTNVYIQQVTIRRVGTAANLFDINAQGLPTIVNSPMKVSCATNTVTLTYSNRQYLDTTIYSTTNLSNWIISPMGTELDAPFNTTAQVGASESKRFFRMVQVQYPGPTLAPENFYGQTLTMNFQTVNNNPYSVVMIMAFNSQGSGAYVIGTNAPAYLYGYSYSNGPYRSSLANMLFLPLRSINLNFASSGAGKFTAFDSSYIYTGTFTLTGQ